MSEMANDVVTVLERYRRAVLRKDVEGMMALYADDVRVFDTWGVWEYDGAAARRVTVAQWFGSLRNETVQVSAEDVRIDGTQDFAFVSAVVQYAAISESGQVLRSMQNRLTWALARREGNWKIVHEHTSTPIGFDDLKAIMHRPIAS
ncbi:nuclear transport factor 2 family protein [Trinickia sp. LjRoot230]|uniref:YybH family protein n=1 Tax=Trinickia sp. LjRoot230 TaxID=3342288 RepID=UPI003ECC9A62